MRGPSEWEERARELTARRMERRRFLQGVLGVSGLALLNGMPLARAALSRTRGGLPSVPSESGLDHIVVTMMENRSFDHFLGWLPGADGVTEGWSNPKRLDVPQGLCQPGGPRYDEALPVLDPTPVATHRLEPHCVKPDPDHGWNGMRVEKNHGMMNGFVERSGDHAMGYYLREDIPMLGYIAAGFTAFDNSFCSVLGPTYPNRLFLHSAYAGTARTNVIPAPTAQDPMPTGYTWPTIWDRLTEAGVDWACYHTDLATIWLFFRHMWQDGRELGRIRHITDYYADAAAGRLPQVAFLDPGFVTIGNDYHPGNGGDLRLAERYVQDTFLALAESPHWPSSAYILTFDESGGWYDHVVPPRLPSLLADEDHCEDWAQAGFRVPTVMASPFARRGFVGHNLYDHTSILKLIEWRFSLEPLTPRDAAANNLGEVLDFENPDLELPDELPFIPLAPGAFACTKPGVSSFMEEQGNPQNQLPGVPLPATVPTPFAKTEAPHQDMLALAEAGFFGPADFRERAKAGVYRT